VGSIERIFVMLLHISHDNYVRRELIAAVLRPDSSPVKRLRKSAEQKGKLIDATSGHRTRSVVVLTTGQVVLTSLNTKTLWQRSNKAGLFNDSSPAFEDGFSHEF
jgi:regulator of extracellular matrix RemA (YlzA/DUF370 family)